MRGKGPQKPHHGNRPHPQQHAQQQPQGRPNQPWFKNNGNNNGSKNGSNNGSSNGNRNPYNNGWQDNRPQKSFFDHMKEIHDMGLLNDQNHPYKVPENHRGPVPMFVSCPWHSLVQGGQNIDADGDHVMCECNGMFVPPCIELLIGKLYRENAELKAQMNLCESYQSWMTGGAPYSRHGGYSHNHIH